MTQSSTGLTLPLAFPPIDIVALVRVAMSAMRLPLMGEMITSAVMELVASLTQRFKIGRIAVVVRFIPMVHEQVTTFAAPFARLFLKFLVVASAASALPIGVIGSRSTALIPAIFYTSERRTLLTAITQLTMRKRLAASPTDVTTRTSLRSRRLRLERLMAGIAGHVVLTKWIRGASVILGAHRPKLLRLVPRLRLFAQRGGFSLPSILPQNPRNYARNWRFV